MLRFEFKAFVDSKALGRAGFVNAKAESAARRHLAPICWQSRAARCISQVTEQFKERV